MRKGSFRSELRVRTPEQALIFENGLKGQISDGAWENSGPSNHWVVWCDAVVKVDPDNTGRNFIPQKDNYDFLRVREYMQHVIFQIRLMKMFGLNLEIVKKAGHLESASDYDKYEEWYGGQPWWKDFVTEVPRWMCEKAEDADKVYNEKMLANDLRELKKIVKKQYEV